MGRRSGCRAESEPDETGRGFQSGRHCDPAPAGPGDLLQIRRPGESRAIWPALHHTGFVFDAAYDGAGSRVVTADRAGAVRVWRWRPNTARLSLPQVGLLASAQFSPDGPVGKPPPPGVDCSCGMPRPASRSRPPMSWERRFSMPPDDPTGTTLAFACVDQTARLWDVASRHEVCPPLHHEADVRRVAFDPGGARLLTITIAAEPERSMARGVGRAHGSVAFGSDLAPHVDRCLRVQPGWTAVFDRLRRWICPRLRCAHRTDRGAHPCTGGYVWEAHFDRDGHRIVAANTDYTFGALSAWIFEVGTSRVLAELPGHRDGVTQAVFDPEGRWVATGSEDSTALLGTPAPARPLAPPLVHRGKITRIQASHDGRYLATASQDDSARVWEVATGEPVTPPLRHSLTVRHLQFSPDDRSLITAGDDGVVCIWDLSPAEGSRGNSGEILSGHRQDSEGELTPLSRLELESLWRRHESRRTPAR